MAGFNDDVALHDEFVKLIRNYGIKTVVETGTYEGETTIQLSKMVENVVTIEINPTYYRKCSHLDEFKNINRIRGASEAVLDEILPVLKKPILFFLDAHWGVNPLHGELDAIYKHKLNDSVIIIHDFLVPGTDLGHDYVDKGNKQPINLEYVASHLHKIYGGNFNYYYNDPILATGSRRGAIFVTGRKQ